MAEPAANERFVGQIGASRLQRIGLNGEGFGHSIDTERDEARCLGCGLRTPLGDDGGRVSVRAFVEGQRPDPPARVLEVGCGEGEFARAIVELGHRVSAIDPDAPEGAIFQAVSLEEFADPGTFDAVVANRALHHIPDLRGALAKVARLLRPGGGLTVNEHAFGRLDDRTACWYLEHSRAFDPRAPRSVEQCRADWEADHAGLHAYAVMIEELKRRFTERFFAWTPYSTASSAMR